MNRCLPAFNPSVHIVLAVLLLITMGLAGCHDIAGTTREDGSGPDKQNDAVADPESEASQPPANETDSAQNESIEPRRPELALDLAPVAGPVYTADPLNFSVHVQGDEASADWAGIRWSQESTEAIGRENLSGADFDGARSSSGTPALPGEYTVVGWVPPGAGAHHVRAHVEVDGFHYWSQEIVVEVTPAVEQVDFDANETVRMRTNLLDPCEGDSYNVDLQIEPGTTVEWLNAASCPHTAKHNASEPLWSTGQVEPNESSSVFQFNRPGVYEVRCDNHPGMTGEIIVG